MSTIKNEQTKENSKRFLMLLSVMILLTVAVLLFLGSNNKTSTGNVKSGDMTSNHDLDTLQELADNANVSFKINSKPIFSNNGSGNLYISNPETNSCDMEVILWIEDLEIYRSGILQPGHYIDYDNLNKSLEPGKYNAIGIIQFYNETKQLNKVSVDIDLTIEN